MLSLPPVHKMYKETLWTIISKTLKNKLMRLKYIESSIDNHGFISWQIEFACVLNGCNADFVNYLKTFRLEFEALFQCKVHRLRYNYKDRITITVTSDKYEIPKEMSKNRENLASDMSVKELPSRDGIGFVPSSAKTLEGEKEVVAKSIDPVTSKVKKNRRSKATRERCLQRYLSKIKEYRESNPQEKKDVTDVISVSSDCHQSDIFDEGSIPVKDDVKFDKKKVDVPEGPDHLKIQARITQQSRSDATARLNDCRIYQMVRLYLAYLGRADSEVIFEGETRTSLGLKIKSEGLPLGSELTDMWYQFCKSRGANSTDVLKDLQAYENYCKSSYTPSNFHSEIARKVGVGKHATSF